MARKLLVSLVLIAIVCLAPGAILRWEIERSVAAKMPHLMGPARSYSVAVSAGLVGLVRGRIEKMNIRGRDVKMSNGVRVDRLDVNLKGVHFKPDQTMTGVDSAAFAASVSEGNLTDYLTALRSDMRGAKITLTDGKLSLSASPRVLAVRTPVSLEGTLRIANGTKLNLVLRKLRASGFRVPGFVRGRIMHDINPVLDTRKLGIGARLDSAEITNGAINVTGTADVGQVLARK